MKIKIFPFDNDIDFEKGSANTLEVWNKKLYINIVESLTNKYQCLSCSERISLIKGDKEIDFSKEIILISDVLRFDLNERRIINKLYSEIDNAIKIKTEFFQETLILFSEINRRIEILLEDFEFDTIYNEDFVLQDYLKMLGLKINYEEPLSFLSKVYQIMDITRELLENKIIILVNCKAYFEKEDLIEIIKYTNYNKNNLLFIENVPGEKLPGETKYIIDDEYEEFLEN